MSDPLNVLLIYDRSIIAEAIRRMLAAAMGITCHFGNNWHLAGFEIKKGIINDLKEDIGEQKVFDDMTLMVLKRVADGGVVPDERFV